MSRSDDGEKLSTLIAELRGRVEQAIQNGQIAGVAPEDLTNLVSGAVKLYATAAEETESELPVIDGTVSTTEAMVVACALLRAHHLNPFDLALWFSRTAPSAR
ncbi:MAG TPA: hypothetical protein VN822_04840 [Candidatus Acidoferrales bacterium]|nr:hypothetical protein [Candidatus Acidoferrales bacterium]